MFDSWAEYDPFTLESKGLNKKFQLDQVNCTNIRFWTLDMNFDWRDELTGIGRVDWEGNWLFTRLAEAAMQKYKTIELSIQLLPPLRWLNHDRHQQVSDQTSPFTNSHRHRHSSFDVHKNLHHLFLWSTLGIGQDCKELLKTFQNYSKMVFGYKHSSAWNFKQTWTHF